MFVCVLHIYYHFYLLSVSVRRSNNSRISPPASEFDLEGVGIIDLALDKYTKKKSDSAVTDKDLITKEFLNHSPEQRERESSSVSSAGSLNSTILPDTEATTGSYGALLRSYAKRNKTKGSAGCAPVVGYVPGNQLPSKEVLGNGDGVENQGEVYDLNLALSLNYEVRVFCVNIGDCATPRPV